MTAPVTFQRLPRRDDAQIVPRPAGDGLFEVDVTWGTVQPVELAPGVRTIAELELIAHLEQGLPVVDTREAHFHREATIPGARGIPHEQIRDHVDDLDPSTATVLFSNGPQCKATPQAIAALRDAGYPPQAIVYYRGGMHDWLTLGYPTVPGVAEQATVQQRPQADSGAEERGGRGGRASRLQSVGVDPDPRFTFANERTFLAWNRTALALIAGGIAAAQLLEFDHRATRLVIAVPLIVLGAVLAFTGYRRWEANERAMRLGRPLAYGVLPRVLAAGIGVVALAATVAILVERGT